MRTLKLIPLAKSGRVLSIGPVLRPVNRQSFLRRIPSGGERRWLATGTTETSAATSTGSSYVPSAKALAYSGAGVLAFGLTLEYAPFFKNTREGIAVAWQWKDLSPGEITDVAEEWVWQFWIGITGLWAGASVTRAAVDRAVQKQYGSLLAPFKVPLLVLGGVLGAKLTTSTAKPAAAFVIFAGRLAEFTLDGLMADFMGKPRDELSWVRKGVHSYSKSSATVEVEPVPYETRSGNILRDLALVKGDINDAEKCGPYRHKLLLVRELGRLREQEKAIRQSSAGDAKAQAKFIEQIEKEKARVKKMCKDLYGIKITKLYEEIQTEAAFKLEDLRAEQIALARGGARVKEIAKLDKEKEKLKAQAKLALGVKLSTLTRPSPKWRTVLREVNAAEQPSSA